MKLMIFRVIRIHCCIVPPSFFHSFHSSVPPVPLNLDAPKNVRSSETTFPTFHPLRSAFISTAALKAKARLVVEAVFHLLIAVPTNVAALGLPLATYDPPASFRCWVNA